MNHIERKRLEGLVARLERELDSAERQAGRLRERISDARVLLSGPVSAAPAPVVSPMFESEGEG